jgi:hypothetical protein
MVDEWKMKGVNSLGSSRVELLTNVPYAELFAVKMKWMSVAICSPASVGVW